MLLRKAVVVRGAAQRLWVDQKRVQAGRRVRAGGIASHEKLPHGSKGLAVPETKLSESNINTSGTYYNTTTTQSLCGRHKAHY